MRVPGAERQVDVAGVPGVRQDINANPDQFMNQTAAFGTEQLGRGLNAASRAAMDVQEQAMQEANQSRVIDAVSQLQLHDVAAQTGANGGLGWARLQGAQALSLPLEQQVAEDRAQVVDGIMSSLGNDEQRRAFSLHVAQTTPDVLGRVGRHVSEQQQVYAQGALSAGMESAAAGAQANYNDAAALRQSVGQIDSYAADLARRSGQDVTFGQVKAQQVKSQALGGALDAALGNNDLHSAQMILRDFGSHMDPNDWLAGTRKMTNANYQQAAYQIGHAVVADVAGKINTGDMDRVLNITFGAESSGQHFGGDGLPVKSGAGAVGIGQVMPDTGPEAAKLAGLPWHPELFNAAKTGDAEHDTAAVNYNKALSSAYLMAQLKKYGDLRQAWAAYNAGPGAVDKAVVDAQKTGGDWLAKLPAETQAYVAKNMNAFSAGEGQYKTPTLAEVVSQADAHVTAQFGPDADPKVRKLAREQAETGYKLQLEAKTQQENEGLAAAYRWVQQYPGKLAQMPAGIRAAVPAGKMDSVVDFDKKLATGLEAKTDWAVYGKLTEMASYDPAAFKKRDLTLDFPNLAPQQREQLLNLQADLNNPAKAPQVTTLENQLSSAFGDVKDKEKQGKFRNAVYQAIAEDRAARSRDLTFEERDRIIKRLMLPTDRGWFGGKKMYEIYGTPEEAVAVPKISDDDRSLIMSALQAEGLPVTESAIRARFNARYGVK